MQMVPAVMFRVVNFSRFLHALHPNWNDFDGALTLTLHDDLLPDQTRDRHDYGKGSGLPEVNRQRTERIFYCR